MRQIEVPGDALAACALDLARRFSAGATLWCWSPRWPQHARHVAVEFVHPVIMGTRALPAEAVADPDPVTAMRTLVESGDAIVAVGPDEPVARDLLGRARAWGATTCWIGFGPPPPHRSADHLLWLADAGPEVAHGGRLVLLYHVLWELTHVCFEHPGLLHPEVPEDAGEVCVTCSDEGRVGEIVRIVDDHEAVVRSARGMETVDVTLVDNTAVDDLILIHAGTAIGHLDNEAGG